MSGSLPRCRIAASFPTADCFAAFLVRGSTLSNASWFRALLYEKKTGEIACIVERRQILWQHAGFEQDALRIGGV